MVADSGAVFEPGRGGFRWWIWDPDCCCRDGGKTLAGWPDCAKSEIDWEGVVYGERSIVRMWKLINFT